MDTKRKFRKFLLVILTLIFLSGNLIVAPKTSAEDDPDYDAYKKYEKYLLYQKKAKYEKYEKYAKYKKKYGFSSSEEKFKAKDGYNKYRQYKKNPAAFPSYAQFYNDYKAYTNYKKYVVEYKKYSRYKKFKKYDKKEYGEGKKYGGQEYKDAHERYKKSRSNGGLGEATLGGGPLGPEISVGLYAFSEPDLRGTYVRVRANRDFVVKNEKNEVIETVTVGEEVERRITYLSNNDLKYYDSDPLTEDINVGSDVYFEAADGDNSAMIFDLNRNDTDNDQFRGKIKIHHYDSPKADEDRIWVINILPLEHYVWGMGEITGTGDMEYNKLMTVIFRTYGYWKIRWSTQFKPQGFTVVNTSSNQIYEGYDYETAHPRIKEAAEATAGKLMMYGEEIALSPYSSWTDGRTRSFEERWGSTLYPWCRSVKDPYGKHPTKSTSELMAGGNHMVGLSAHGALNLATDYDWDWDRILSYYYHKVRFIKAY